MIVCPECQQGPTTISRVQPTRPPRPVYRWELCAGRPLRCVNRSAHLTRMIQRHRKEQRAHD